VGLYEKNNLTHSMPFICVIEQQYKEPYKFKPEYLCNDIKYIWQATVADG